MCKHTQKHTPPTHSNIHAYKESYGNTTCFTQRSKCPAGTKVISHTNKDICIYICM